MPRDLKQLLEDTAVRPTRPLDADAILRRARRQRHTARAALAMVACAAVLSAILAGGVLLDRSPDNSILLGPGPQPSWGDTAGFTGLTETVLVFDTGADGVLAVDLDAGLAARRSLEGHRAGDQPYRLWRTGDALVVGWERVYAVPIATGQSQLVGEADVFVPAAEPDHVWLIDFSGGRNERGAPVTYRLVTSDGEVQVEAAGIEDHVPARGVLGGLALEAEAGVAIWDAQARDVVRRLGEGPGFVADAQGRTVVWCESTCSQLHVTDLDGEDHTFRLLPEAGEVFDARSARLSPDGRYVAAIAGAAGPLEEGSAGTVLLLDLASGQVDPITAPLVPRPAYLGWTPDGSQLFFSSDGHGAAQTDVGRYAIAVDSHSGSRRDRGGQLELVTIPVGGTLSFVTLHQDEAQAVLEGAERLTGGNTGRAGDGSVPAYDRAVELAAEGPPLAATAVVTERFGQELPPKDGAGENPCCLVRHPVGPGLVDDVQNVLRIYPGEHSVGYGSEDLRVMSAAALDSGVVALLGFGGGPALVVLPLHELPDLTQASGPFFEPSIQRIDVPDDANAVAAGLGGFWVRAGDGWTRVTDAAGAAEDPAGPGGRLVLWDGSAVDAEARVDGSAVLHQASAGFTLRLKLTVPGRRVSIQRIEAADGPAPHTLLVVLRVDGGQAPEHRMLGISGAQHVDYGTLAPGDTWTERLAITKAGELYHLHSDDVAATVTRYAPDLTRLD